MDSSGCSTHFGSMIFNSSFLPLDDVKRRRTSCLHGFDPAGWASQGWQPVWLKLSEAENHTYILSLFSFLSVCSAALMDTSKCQTGASTLWH